MTDHPRARLADLEAAAPFADRHIGPAADEQAKMLAVVGYGSLDELADAAVPDAIRATERARPAGGRERAAGARRAARARRAQPGASLR